MILCQTGLIFLASCVPEERSGIPITDRPIRKLIRSEIDLYSAITERESSYQHES